MDFRGGEWTRFCLTLMCMELKLINNAYNSGNGCLSLCLFLTCQFVTVEVRVYYAVSQENTKTSIAIRVS